MVIGPQFRAKFRINQDAPAVTIAVKCFTRFDVAEPEEDEVTTADSIEEEILVWKLLSDLPQVVSLLGLIEDFGHFAGYSYIPPYPVSEYHELGPLSMFVYRFELSDRDRLQLLAGVAYGLMHIHSRLIVHGDIKAGNVLIYDTGDGYVPRICDFGSSHSNCDACYAGRSKTKKGTEAWMSPERFVDAEMQPGTFKSDIWSFGCVALEVQFKEIPYATNLLGARFKISQGDPPATSQILIDNHLSDNEIAGFVWAVMQKCWEWEPTRRPDAPELFAELALALSPTV